MNADVVLLPAKGRGYWVMTLAGVVLGGLGIWGLTVAGARLESAVTAYLTLGAGVFLTFFGALFAFAHRPPARLEIGARHLRLVERCGDAVELPWSTLEAIELVESQQGGARHTFTLRKRDGGIIELDAYRRREQALALAKPVIDALDDVSEGEPLTPTPPAPARGEAPYRAREGWRRRSSRAIPDFAADTIAGVDLERTADRVVLSWKGAASALRLLALGPFAGMGIIVFGFHVADPSAGTIGAMAFVALMATLLVGSWLWSLGTRHRITIDERNLVVERLRGDRVVDRKAVPIFSVVTVDYSDRLNVHGESLTIRTGKGRDVHDSVIAELEATAAKNDDDPNPIALGMALMKLVSSGITVPLGSLSRAACIALDLTVSAEVARRTGKTPGLV
jgi:hypothetical protein